MIKIIVLVITVIIGLLCGLNFFALIKNAEYNFGMDQYFFLGGMTFSLYIVYRYEKKIEFYSTFEHELTHNLWAMLFFKKPVGFQVNKDGTGLFQWTGSSKLSSIFILLAPYFFPTACFLWLPFHVMCKEEYYWFYFMMMGIFFGYHLMSTYQEIGAHQSDITTNGIFYSYTVILALFIVFHGIILTHMLNGFIGVKDFLITHNIEIVKTFF